MFKKWKKQQKKKKMYVEQNKKRKNFNYIQTAHQLSTAYNSERWQKAKQWMQKENNWNKFSIKTHKKKNSTKQKKKNWIKSFKVKEEKKKRKTFC